MKDKVAMVGGASRGLGRATARALGAEGARLSLTARTPSDLEAAARALRDETGADVLAVPADVRAAADLDRWFARTEERFGGLDLLFFNAGGPPAGSFFDFGDDDWQAAFELLTLSAVRMIRAAVPLMRARGGGSIVVSTSSSVREVSPSLTLSTVMRAPVVALAKALSVELAPHGIRVNHLIPGRIYTDRVQELDERHARDEGITVETQRERSQAAIPAGRYGRPIEYGRAAAFLLSDAASYITGAALQVDGGKIQTIL